MKNPLLFPFPAASRCIIASDAGQEAMFLLLLWNMRIIPFRRQLKLLADRAGVDLPEIEYSDEVKKKEGKKAKTAGNQ